MGRGYSHAAENKFQQDRRVSRRADRYGAAHFNWVTVHQFTHWLEHCRYQAPGNLEIACLAELSKSALWEMTYRLAEDIFTLVSKCAHQSKLSCAAVHLQNYEYRSTNEIWTTDVVSWKIQINYSLLGSCQIDLYCHVCLLCQTCIVRTSTAFIELYLGVNRISCVSFYLTLLL